MDPGGAMDPDATMDADAAMDAGEGIGSDEDMDFDEDMYANEVMGAHQDPRYMHIMNADDALAYMDARVAASDKAWMETLAEAAKARAAAATSADEPFSLPPPPRPTVHYDSSVPDTFQIEERWGLTDLLAFYIRRDQDPLLVPDDITSCQPWVEAAWHGEDGQDLMPPQPSYITGSDDPREFSFTDEMNTPQPIFNSGTRLSDLRFADSYDALYELLFNRLLLLQEYDETSAGGKRPTRDIHPVVSLAALMTATVPGFRVADDGEKSVSSIGCYLHWPESVYDDYNASCQVEESPSATSALANSPLDATPGRLPCLPNETWTSILSYLPNMAALERAARVSRQMSLCATSATLAVLEREMGTEVLRDAIIELESSKLPLLPASTAQEDWAAIFDRRVEFTATFLAQRPDIPRVLSVPDAAHLFSVYAAVRYFARNFQRLAYRRLFIETVLFAPRRHGRRPAIEKNGVFSTEETARFMRAFYRLETYRNLYREPKHIHYHGHILVEQRMHFFSHLTYWEKEQLVAAAEYLAADVVEEPLKRLQELSEQDDEFDFEPEIGGQPASYLQLQWRILSYGLRFLHKVARSPDDAFPALLKELPEDERPVETENLGDRENTWLVDAFRACLNATSYHADDMSDPTFFQALERYPVEDYRVLVRRSVIESDGDMGPENAWLWAYKGFSRNRLCYDSRLINCRRFGYVFWDEKKISKVNFMQCLDIWRWQWLPERPVDWEWTIDLPGRISPVEPLGLVRT